MENLLLINKSSSRVSVNAPEINKVFSLGKGKSEKLSRVEFDLIKHRLAPLADLLSVEIDGPLAESAPVNDEHESDLASHPQREEIKSQLLELKAQIKVERNADKKTELKKQFNDLKLKLN